MRGRYFRHARMVRERIPWYLVDNGSRLEHDRNLVSAEYPGLNYQVDDGLEAVFLQGPVTFVGRSGIPTDVEVKVEFPSSYPQHEPRAYDPVERFPHIADRHFFTDGQCCLWLPPETIWNLRDADCLLLFLDQVAIFFHKQLICDASGRNVFPGSQRSHGDAGYIEYIQEMLRANDDILSLLVPLLINGGEYIGRNDLCLCGSGRKYKHCHLHSIRDLMYSMDTVFLRNVLWRWYHQFAQ